MGVQHGIHAILHPVNHPVKAEALLGVKSPAEFFELQTSFIRKQAELTVEQAKSIQETTKQVAEKLAKPSKDAAEKAMASFKVA
jgi:hypothetical protein